MPHPKQHIRDLAHICLKRNIKRIIISPGSRSAPLIKAFYEAFGEECVSIVDERSAAYFALGNAVYSGQPVALICTSGTAVLNYAPALAEAYYQQVPLLAITADRPREWIDQHDNQTLRQNNIYRNYVKGSFELPQFIATDDDVWFARRTVNEAINLCMELPCGPVHINVPLTEPLYDQLPPPSENLETVELSNASITLKLPDNLMNEWKNARRIMIIHGQDTPGNEMPVALKPLLKDPRIIIIAENISNIQDKSILSNSNIVLSINRSKNPDYPDLILHSGGQVVSKALTAFLRKAEGVKTWRIGKDNRLIDTFKMATRLLPYAPWLVYSELGKWTNSEAAGSYRDQWLTLAAVSNKVAEQRISQLPFSDVHVFRKVMLSLPSAVLLAMGNSSVIRYSQLFPVNTKASYYSNRGVSGIDGSLSAAAGIAFASQKLTISIVGDLGFLYDSNALWNNALPVNLRILVINNHGGGIFHILKGPSEYPGFKKFIEAHHPVNIAKLAEAYGLKYLFADDEASLAVQWTNFIKRHTAPVVFEVKTDAAISASAFRKLMASS